MLKTIAAAGFAGSLFFLSPGSTGPPPSGGLRQVRFVNDGGEPIAELFVATDGAGDWQADRLGLNYLAPGDAVLVDVEDRNESCRIDLKIVRDDGSELVGHDIDICRRGSAPVPLR